jgi:DNA-binding transcriptional ArsR family regulator
MTSESAAGPQGFENLDQIKQRLAPLEARAQQMRQAREALAPAAHEVDDNNGRPRDWTDDALERLDELLSAIEQETGWSRKRNLRKLLLPKAQELYPNLYGDHRDGGGGLYKAYQRWLRDNRKRATADAPKRDRWMSRLWDWANEAKRHPPCRSREQLCELINRLNAIPAPWNAQIDQLFMHMERRRHSWRGRQKIEWLEAVPGRLARNPLDWPIPATRRGRPDKQAGLVLAAVRKGKETKDEIAHDTGINPDSLQTLLNRMVESKELRRTERNRYVEWTDGLVSYERPDVDKEILNALADGWATPRELRDRIGCSQGAINKGLSRLRDAGKIILIDRINSAERGRAALYGLPETAAPYVFVEDAIFDALQSGSKTDPELVDATRRKLSAIKAARGRLEAKGVVKRDGFRGGFTVWALSRQRARRPAHGSKK